MKRETDPTPLSVHNHLLRYLSERVAIETVESGDEPAGSRARWLLKWAHMLKPRRNAP